MAGRLLKRRLVAVLLPVGLFLIALSIYGLFRRPAQERFELTITAGSSRKTRHRLTSYLVDEARDLGVDLQLVDSVGSVEALDLVESGQVDVALIQGGIRAVDRPHVRQVAAIYTEPLHLLVRPELSEAVSRDLSALRGTTIELSRPGSGTNLLARHVLEFAGFRHEAEGNVSQDYTASMLGYAPLLRELERLDGEADRDRGVAALPDAVFVVSTVPSSVAKELVTRGGYRLVPLRFGEAFSLISVEDEAAEQDEIAEIHIRTTEIPAFAYQVSPPVPAEPCPTLGTRLLMVAHEDVPEEAVEGLLQIVYEGPIDKLFRLEKLSELLPEYPLHAGAIRYRDRDKPIIRAEIVETFQKLAGVAGPLFGGLLALYGFVRWRQTLKFQTYFTEICEVRAIAAGHKSPAGRSRSRTELLLELEDRLDDLQHRAVTAFSDQYFYGEGVMEILLALLTDVRSTLHRVMGPTIGPARDAVDDDTVEADDAGDEAEPALPGPPTGRD